MYHILLIHLWTLGVLPPFGLSITILNTFILVSITTERQINNRVFQLSTEDKSGTKLRILLL